MKGEKVEGLQSGYKAFDSVCTVPAGKFRRYHGESFLAHLVDIKTLLLNVRDFFRVVRGFFVSRRLLKTIRPRVVFSKGGFVAVPVGLAARTLGIPIITHDSDVVPGLANRLLSRWAVLHAVGMPKQYYSYSERKMVFTGIPLNKNISVVDRSAKQAFKKDLGLSSETKVLTVAGGGLGSVRVNKLVASIAPNLLNRYKNLRIFHFCGASNLEQTKALYAEKLGVEEASRLVLKGFSDQFYKYTGVADVVIARAGATTIAELALQAKALVVIPSPFLTGAHQLKNADMLAKNQAAVVFSEDKPADELEAVVDSLLNSPANRKRLALSLAKLAKPNAASELAEAVLKIAASSTENTQ